MSTGDPYARATGGQESYAEIGDDSPPELLRAALVYWRTERNIREARVSTAHSAYIAAGTNTYKAAQAGLAQRRAELAYADRRIRELTKACKDRGLIRDRQ